MRYEIAFMLYGIAFLMILPVVPIFLVDDLALDYKTIGLAKGTVFQVIMILGIPLFGRWFDRSTPHRTSAVSFASGILFPLTLLLALYVPDTMRVSVVFISFIFFGITMSGINVIWNLSSMRFAGEKEDAGIYQSVHLSATGIRGLFAPLLGYFVMHFLGKQAALLISSCLWLIAAFAMILARWIDIRKGSNYSLRV